MAVLASLLLVASSKWYLAYPLLSALLCSCVCNCHPIHDHILERDLEKAQVLLEEFYRHAPVSAVSKFIRLYHTGSEN